MEIYTRKPHDINTDGELTVSTPATFRVIPQALAVFTESTEN
jgi:diacylglycerol kinase family enzyme